MKIFELFWEKVGTIAIASLIGAAYGLLISPIILYLFPQIAVTEVVKIFSLIFLTISLISGKFLIESILGLIYTIAGFFIALVAIGGMDIQSSEEEIKKIIRSSAILTFLGVLCGVFAVLLYK